VVDHLNHTMSAQPQLFDVFLSHAHVDGELVEELGVRLEDRANIRVWLDRWILVPGEHWQQEMAKGLEQAKTCAVCIGDATPRGWFREEIERALNLQTKKPDFRVIPVILPNGNPSVIDNFLELRTWVHFKEGPQDPRAFHLLVSGVRGTPPGRIKTKANDDPGMLVVRETLARIRSLRQDQLIDDDIALEYQRRVLESLITRVESL